nr:unnamed protein product [Timema bartmani]
MKFVIQSVSSHSSRLGCILDIERLPGAVFETPLLLLYTKGGCIPHLTHEVLQMVTKEPLCLQVPLSSTVHNQTAVAAYKKGIAEFIGLKEHLIYSTVQDPAMATPQGYNEKDFVSVWSRSGKQQINADKYMDVIESFQPDMYQALCDGDTNLNSSKKRVSKALDRSSKMFWRCLERHEKSEVLKKTALLAVLEGGYNLTSREASAKMLSSCDVAGFVIDGLHNNGPDVELLPFEKIKPAIQETVNHLPADKFRIAHGCWNPETVLDLVKEGIDIFDSSYPFLVSERGSALVFNFKGSSSIPHPVETSVKIEPDELRTDDGSNNPFNGTTATSIDVQDGKSKLRSGVIDLKYEISMREKV